MSATQRYKQAQQQTRVITNENGYLKGMYFTDTPLPEGYVKTLVNLDIDSMSGKLTPRAGLQNIGIIDYDKTGTMPSQFKGHNPLVMLNDNPAERITYGASKLCGHTTTNQVVQSIVYHNCSIPLVKGIYAIVYAPNLQEEEKYYAIWLGDVTSLVNAEMPTKQIHNRVCVHNELFRKPVGAFLNDQYFQFAKTKYAPDAKLELVYTKRGADILASELNEDILIAKPEDIKPERYYVCNIPPTQLSPSLAATQGFNMLLDEPYKFECKLAMIPTILGIIPYNEDGQPVLAPKLNEKVILTAYYNAPSEYRSSEFQAKTYATSYQKITKLNDEGKTEEVDPDVLAELETWLDDSANPSLSSYSIGSYWYATADHAYYMVKYRYDHTKANPELEKVLVPFDPARFDTKPGYSEKLNVIEKYDFNETPPETDVKIIWEARQSTASDWQELESSTRKFSELYHPETQTFDPLTIYFDISNPEVMVRLRIVDPAPEGEDLDIVLATQTIGISTATSEDNNVYAKKYDLAQCTGMCEWEQRLVLWGVPDALNTVFVSDLNNPNYFPYPNNIDTFPDPVMGVYNYGDELIVLTTNSLYRLTWSVEGTGWTHTLVQRNLHITEADLSMNCVIKNMFFFKSGNQYYMMVPKSSIGVKGETTIAPISKSIEAFLENFHEEVYKITKLMKNDFSLPDFTQRLVYYHSFVDGNVVALNYVYDVDYDKQFAPIEGFTNAMETSKYFYVQLRYDTDTRTWSLRMFSTPYILQVPYVDAMGQSRYTLPIQGSDGTARLQYCEFKNNTDNLAQYYTASENITHNGFVRNYQYIDTGNREINTEHKKRFREFQFKIKNIDTTELAFYTGFYVDGAERKNIIKYDVSVDKDEIIVTPTLDESKSYNAEGLFMPTELGTETSKTCWVVGDSAFPGRTLWKVRMPVSGKGYTPRVELLSLNEQRYEILGHSWVYRTMDAR